MFSVERSLMINYISLRLIIYYSIKSPEKNNNYLIHTYFYTKISFKISFKIDKLTII